MNRPCCCSSFKVSESVRCQWSQRCSSVKVSPGPNRTPGNFPTHKEQLLSIKVQRNMKQRQWRAPKLQCRGHFQMSAMKLYAQRQAPRERKPYTGQKKYRCFSRTAKDLHQLRTLFLWDLLLFTQSQTALHTTQQNCDRIYVVFFWNGVTYITKCIYISVHIFILLSFHSQKKSYQSCHSLYIPF